MAEAGFVSCCHQLIPLVLVRVSEMEFVLQLFIRTLVMDATYRPGYTWGQFKTLVEGALSMFN